MGVEFLAIVASIVAVFIAFIHFRLNYIDKQFDDLLPAFKSRQDVADKGLQAEIAKSSPEKDSVLSQGDHLEWDIDKIKGSWIMIIKKKG